jgi:hypothetical protein
MERINSRIDEEFCQEAWDVINDEEKINSVNSEATPENAVTLINQSANNLRNFLKDSKLEKKKRGEVVSAWSTFIASQGARTTGSGRLFEKVVEKHIENLSLFTDDRFEVCFQTPCNRF